MGGKLAVTEVTSGEKLTVREMEAETWVNFHATLENKVLIVKDPM